MDQTRTVLIVDDDADMQFLLGIYAGDAGFTVAGQVGDGRAALEEWRRRREAGTPLDAIVLDQMMPHLTGLEVIDAIRAEDPDVVLVLVSAAMSADLANAARSAGADHSLPKNDLRGVTAALND